MNKLEKYSSYKDSGIEWLGEIPSEWETQKMKYIGKIFAGLTDKKGDDFSKEAAEDKEPFIPFTNICNNLKIDKNQMQYVRVKAFEKQNKVQKNDIIFLMSSETLDDIGKCSIHLNDENFYLNSFCKGFRTYNKKVNSEFLNYLLQSKTYRNYFALVGRGFTRINIKQEYINDLFTVLPSDEEQIKIASFLDTKTEQLDKAIKQKEQLIELLKEQRQILINDAVTKGIDKTVAMKDSGVDWIGEIPAGWEVKKVKNIFSLIIDPAPNNNDEELLSIYTDIGVKPRKELAEKGNKASTTDGYWRVKKGDFIVNKLLAWMGAIGLSNYDGVTSPAYDILRAKIDTVGIYYHELFRLKVFSQEMKKHSRGIMDMRLRLYFDKFGDIRVPYPKQKEQQKIVNYIEENNKKINKAIDLQQKQITKLKEYKTTLIDSVVTGKVRVV